MAGGGKVLLGVLGLASAAYFRILSPKLVGGVGVIGAGLVALLVAYQEKILYIPEIQGIKTPRQNPQGYQSPDQQGLVYEEVWMTTPDGVKLHGWFIPSPTEPAMSPTLLFCHENAGNIGLRIDEFKALHGRLKANQFVFDYRGYGFSSGEPSQDGLVTDAVTALHWLQTRADEGKIDGQKLVLTGRSLGGAVAIHLAEKVDQLGLRHPPKALIVENSFTSISDMVDEKFPILNVPFFKDYFLRLKWDSLSIVPRLALPILFLSSIHDEIVPAKQMQQLKTAATSASDVEFHSFSATHNDIWLRGQAPYWNAKKNFVYKVTGPPTK